MNTKYNIEIKYPRKYGHSELQVEGPQQSLDVKSCVV